MKLPLIATHINTIKKKWQLSRAQYKMTLRVYDSQYLIATSSYFVLS